MRKKNLFVNDNHDLESDMMRDFYEDRPEGFQPLFFKPNSDFVKWLIAYANGRIIIDIGCGERFQLIQQMHANGYTKTVGIDPAISMQELELQRIKHGFGLGYHILPGTGQRWKDMFQMKNALMLFVRPCHSNFVEECLDLKGDDVEVLYITVPDNIDRYDDLGAWRNKAKLIQHEGTSADKEIVYSIK